MNRMLRGFLLALVLANLLFVQITRAAGLRWLVPLYALAFSSPLLVRFQESWLYRALWNATVICVFAVLVQDATLTGILHLLEDGLVLAALCQVHLLNNLGRGQKPDLLFFNSFLITLVTCFFSQDLGFSLLFLAYAPLLLISMQLACLTRRGEEPSFTTLRLVAGDGLRRSVILIGVTAVVFLCFPRDFRREGFVGARLDLFSLPARNELGFSEEVRLGRTGQTTASNRVVLKARLLRGLPEQVPSYWRGATFTRLMGNGWQADRFVQSVSRFETDDW
ncbi:MAG: DUF3488 domain-containing protein, partial [Planctomycetota bacterium]